MKKTKHFFILVLVISIFSFSVCTGSEKSPPPTIPEQEKSLALTQIKGYPEVLDAAITQKTGTLSLALIVDHGTSETRAKELGDNFVRLVKTFSKDTSPGKEIGSGIYDYIIGVYLPNQKEIVTGAKSSIGRYITW